MVSIHAHIYQPNIVYLLFDIKPNMSAFGVLLFSILRWKERKKQKARVSHNAPC